MLVRCLEKGKAVRDTRIRDVFTKEEVEDMSAKSADNSVKWAQWRSENEEEPSTSWSAKRTFLKAWAVEAAIRTGFSRSEDPEAYEQEVHRLFCLAIDLAFALIVFCYLCGVQLTFDRRTMRRYGSKDREGVLISSTNFSPDRRVHTDVYGIKTTSPACWPCNCIKGGYPEASARKLLDAMADAKLEMGDGGFITPAVEGGGAVEASASTEGFVEKNFARAAIRRAKAIGENQPVKQGKLTFEHVLGLAKEASVGGGRARE